MRLQWLGTEKGNEIYYHIQYSLNKFYIHNHDIMGHSIGPSSCETLHPMLRIILFPPFLMHPTFMSHYSRINNNSHFLSRF